MPLINITCKELRFKLIANTCRYWHVFQPTKSAVPGRVWYRFFFAYWVFANLLGGRGKDAAINKLVAWTQLKG